MNETIEPMREVRTLMDLTGRCALVTGAAGHIGLAICEALVELGATVAIVDLEAEQCRERAATLDKHRPGAAIPLPADLSDEGATRSCVAAALRALGRLDILFHSAAYVGTTRIPGWAVPFTEQTAAAWDAALRVNLTAAFVLAQAAATALAQSGHGSIVLLSSIYGIVGPDMRLYEGTAMANPAGYAASKGALLQLTRYLATVLAPRVRVNAITPGGVWRHQPESFHEQYKARTPLGRMANEEDLKGAAAFLASDLSAYVTGHNLVVDGGWTAW